MDLTIPEQDLALKRRANDFAETQLFPHEDELGLCHVVGGLQRSRARAADYAVTPAALRHTTMALLQRRRRSPAAYTMLAVQFASTTANSRIRRSTPWVPNTWSPATSAAVRARDLAKMSSM